MNGFATWLSGLDAGQDDAARRLQEFAAATPGWPSSDNVADYVQFVAQRADPATRDQLLATRQSAYRCASVPSVGWNMKIHRTPAIAGATA